MGICQIFGVGEMGISKFFRVGKMGIVFVEV